MGIGRRVVVAAALGGTLMGAIGAAAVAGTQSGKGTLTQGISFPGPFSGPTTSTAGVGHVPEGSDTGKVKILLPAYTIPNAGGGQDENHALAVLQGHVAGLWIVGVRVTPGVSDYNKSTGTLTVWLNKPAPSRVAFSYLAFGLFND
jgi:hypothetical protein